MILKEISDRIIVDEIPAEAKASEIYFLSHLLDNALLSITKEWKGIIFTSAFIYDVLKRRKGKKADQTRFRLLKANVANKFKIKGKPLWVTMFETGEVTKNVMFLFNDGDKNYLYTGVFSEVGTLCKNDHLMLSIGQGIHTVYVDTRRCKGKSYIFTEDTIEEIKAIIAKHPDSKILLIVPAFGYEKLLVSLAKAFPKNINTTKYQNIMLTKLGYDDLLNSDTSSRIIVRLPGILSDVLSSDEVVTIYITEGSPPKTSKEYGAYTVQWSPLPSFMDLMFLLEIIKPKEIIPIKTDGCDDDLSLPASFEWLIDKPRAEENPNKTDAATLSDLDTLEGNSDSVFSVRSLSNCSIESVKEVVNACTTPETKVNDELVRISQPQQVTVQKKDAAVHKFTDLTKKRLRTLRHRTVIDFDDSHESD